MRLFIVRHSKIPDCGVEGVYHCLKHGSLCAQIGEHGLMQGVSATAGTVQYVLAEHVKRIKCNKVNLRKFDKLLRSSK